MKSEFDEEYKRLRRPKNSIWADRSFSAFCVSIAIYMVGALVLRGFESFGDALRLLLILTTFGITYGSLYHAFFKE